MTKAFTSSEPGAAPGHRNGAYAWYVTVVLLIIYTYSYIDRQVMNLLVEPVRTSFVLSDTQVSLLLGFAFIVAYAFAAPFGGRLADRSRRKTIIVVAVTLWSLFTVACGFAPSYGLLFAARMAVGATEALLLPSAWSLIADYFTREKLPRAMGLFLLGPYLGGGLALILGGALVHGISGSIALEGWRQAFIAAGAIGIIPAVLAVTLREAPRGQSGAPQAAPGLTEIWQFVMRNRRFYASFYGGISLQTITFFAFPAWMPTYIVRHFSVSLREIGFHYGLITVVVGCVGVLVSPLLARALEARGYQDANMRIAAISSTLMIPFALLIPFAPSYGAALAIMAAVTFIGSLPMPTNAAALQMVTPNRMRGVAASAYMFIIALVGVAAPPTLIALLTDQLFQDPAMVGYSLGITCLGASIAAAATIWLSLPAYQRSLAQAEADQIPG